MTPEHTVNRMVHMSVNISHDVFQNMLANVAALELERDTLRTQKQALLDACKKAQIAITDWLYQYASELCDSDDVADSCTRIANAGGTIAYIADVCEKNSLAIATAEQAQKEGKV